MKGLELGAEASPRGAWPSPAPAPGAFEQTFCQDTTRHKDQSEGEIKRRGRRFMCRLNPQGCPATVPPALPRRPTSNCTGSDCHNEGRRPRPPHPGCTRSAAQASWARVRSTWQLRVRMCMVKPGAETGGRGPRTAPPPARTGNLERGLSPLENHMPGQKPSPLGGWSLSISRLTKPEF